MAIEIFNRYENKYLVDADTLPRLQSRLSDCMELDAYNKKFDTYPISNLYYDTDDSHLIRTSLSKPSYKEKLRLRAYGVPDGESKVYVEIKKKFKGLVNKRRSAMKLGEAYGFLGGGSPEFQPYMNRQVLNEVACMLERSALSPALYLAYDRRAYFGEGQHDLRVSFDTNIRTRRCHLRLEDGGYCEKLLGGGLWIMEVKVAQSIPIWLCRLLSEYKISPISFSKYGTEYKQRLSENRSVAIQCLTPFSRSREPIRQSLSPAYSAL
ncbi:molecular chaperone [Clostridia bacterium]|nr:molecular chaperone [Clostridia bacterium]